MIVVVDCIADAELECVLRCFVEIQVWVEVRSTREEGKTATRQHDAALSTTSPAMVHIPLFSYSASIEYTGHKPFLSRTRHVPDASQHWPSTQMTNFCNLLRCAGQYRLEKWSR
jgi:hypothetical protein